MSRGRGWEKSFYIEKKSVLNQDDINNNQLILEGLIRAMPQLTEHNQLM